MILIPAPRCYLLIPAPRCVIWNEGKFSFLFFFLQGLDHSAVGLNLVSNIIKDELGLPEVSVLMGANLAKEVAREMFGEATIGKELVFIF